MASFLNNLRLPNITLPARNVYSTIDTFITQTFKLVAARSRRGQCICCGVQTYTVSRNYFNRRICTPNDNENVRFGRCRFCCCTVFPAIIATGLLGLVLCLGHSSIIHYLPSTTHHYLQILDFLGGCRIRNQEYLWNDYTVRKCNLWAVRIEGVSD
jgi:hypothetical protein